MIQKTIEIWQGYSYPGAADDSFQPTLTTYVLSGEKTRPAVLILPGGGYGFTSPREAEPIAVQFNAAGFHAFVLNYSVAPRRHPVPVQDVSRAMCVVRDNAEDWQVDPECIAVCGFSAGGHLAASLGVFWDEPAAWDVAGVRRGGNRPSALILCYPVISAGKDSHQGSFRNLLGEDSTAEQWQEMSVDRHINRKTPPTFLWHTVEDTAVPVANSLLFASGLAQQGILFELHVYEKGPHGLSLATAETDSGAMGEYPRISGWIDLCTGWLRETFSVCMSPSGAKQGQRQGAQA